MSGRMGTYGIPRAPIWPECSECGTVQWLVNIGLAPWQLERPVVCGACQLARLRAAPPPPPDGQLDLGL